MFIKVRIIGGFPRPLWYKMAEKSSEHIIPGMLVQVPLQKRQEIAFVEEISYEKPLISADLREISGVIFFSNDKKYLEFMHQLAQQYHISISDLFLRLKNYVLMPELKCEEKSYQPFNENILHLNDEQKEAVKIISASFEKKQFSPFLLHGVTGSGKTEVYIELIKQQLALGNNIIFLAPEVSLASHLAQRIKKRISTHHVISFHSAIKTSEKKQVWQLLQQNTEPFVLIGVHVPILLPIQKLGLIIVDEEHENGYQEKKHPKINSRDAALLRAQKLNIPILLGSATPSMQALHAVKTKKWDCVSLKKRYASSFPTIKRVLLTEKKKRPHFWITQELYTAIADRLQRKEQTLLFLNRRGHSFFVQCSACSAIASCNKCSVSLTLHDDNMLRCHYCSYNTPAVDHCTVCLAAGKTLIKKGIGTQQLVSIVQKLFPHARVERADADITVKRKKWAEILDDMHNGTIDILIGTQSITKGYHFPKVTLVGVIWADMHLALPKYHATETTLQQIIQVAGRAGRQSPESTVIIQSMRDYSFFSYISEENYAAFYEYELTFRQMLSYPPVSRLIEIEVRNEDEEMAIHHAEQFVLVLQALIEKEEAQIEVLGPVKPPIFKIQNVFSNLIYIKGNNLPQLTQFISNACRQVSFNSKILVTPQPR